MFSARCETDVTGLGATDTYGAREMRCCCCCSLYEAASYQAAEGVTAIGLMF